MPNFYLGIWMREPGEIPGHCQHAVYVRGYRLRRKSVIGKLRRLGGGREDNTSHYISQKTYDD